MNVVQACLSVMKARESCFHQCLCTVKLVSACLSAAKVVQSHVDHREGSVKLE